MTDARYLLDTHALLFWLFGDKRLSKKARKLLGDAKRECLVSAASVFEIATKHRLGKLPGAAHIAHDVPAYVLGAGFSLLDISPRHAQQAGAWATPHRDPFDRLLAAQALLERVPLV